MPEDKISSQQVQTFINSIYSLNSLIYTANSLYSRAVLTQPNTPAGYTYRFNWVMDVTGPYSDNQYNPNYAEREKIYKQMLVDELHSLRGYFDSSILDEDVANFINSNGETGEIPFDALVLAQNLQLAIDAKEKYLLEDYSGLSDPNPEVVALQIDRSLLGFIEATETDQMSNKLAEDLQTIIPEGWSYFTEKSLLATLQREIGTMRQYETILGVSIANIIAGFQQYHDYKVTESETLLQIQKGQQLFDRNNIGWNEYYDRKRRQNAIDVLLSLDEAQGDEMVLSTELLVVRAREALEQKRNERLSKSVGEVLGERGWQDYNDRLNEFNANELKYNGVDTTPRDFTAAEYILFFIMGFHPVTAAMAMIVQVANSLKQEDLIGAGLEVAFTLIPFELLLGLEAAARHADEIVRSVDNTVDYRPLINIYRQNVDETIRLIGEKSSSIPSYFKNAISRETHLPFRSYRDIMDNPTIRERFGLGKDVILNDLHVEIAYHLKLIDEQIYNKYQQVLEIGKRHNSSSAGICQVWCRYHLNQNDTLENNLKNYVNYLDENNTLLHELNPNLAKDKVGLVTTEDYAQYLRAEGLEVVPKYMSRANVIRYFEGKDIGDQSIIMILNTGDQNHAVLIDGVVKGSELPPNTTQLPQLLLQKTHYFAIRDMNYPTPLYVSEHDLRDLWVRDLEQNVIIVKMDN